jgi:FKBP-type peptidyl-prolyl cis-trans isomerase (trigger factor)
MRIFPLDSYDMTEPITPIITKNDDSTVTIESEIPAADFDKHKGAALKSLGREVAVDGFRKGHVPEDILVKHVGEHSLLHEMAERALAEHYGKLLVEHKIDAIGRPNVTITKLAFGNPLGFKLTTAVLPTFELPDYKSLSALAVKDKASSEPEVSDEEADVFIKNLLTERVKGVKNDGTEAPADIPEITDDIAKSFGDFKDAADMRAKVKEGMALDKKRTQREERRMAVIEALVKDTKIALPDVLIEAELDKIVAQFEHDLARMGLTPKDYLARINKDEKAMRADFRGDAEKRAKIQLILSEIGMKENLLPTKEEISHEVDHVLAHHPPHEGHNETRERESAALYVTTILTNEKVLAFLENQTN